MKRIPVLLASLALLCAGALPAAAAAPSASSAPALLAPPAPLFQADKCATCSELLKSCKAFCGNNNVTFHCQNSNPCAGTCTCTVAPASTPAAPAVQAPPAAPALQTAPAPLFLADKCASCPDLLKACKSFCGSNNVDFNCQNHNPCAGTCTCTTSPTR